MAEMRTHILTTHVSDTQQASNQWKQASVNLYNVLSSDLPARMMYSNIASQQR